MQESMFERRKLRYPELNRFKSSRKSIGRTKTGLMNLYSASQMHLRSTKKDARKGLGHDLDQLTKGNQHEVNLSPHPSLTIMVQPNKIDYTERSKYAIVVIKRSFHVLNIFEFLSFATTHYDETDP